MNNVENIYICHYTPLTQRKKRMIEQCAIYNISNKIKFIEEYDRENIPQNILDMFDLNICKPAQISLFSKHIHAMKQIIDSGHEYGIIMEDDVIFKNNFINDFNYLLREIPENFDILYMGFFPFEKEFKQRNPNKKIMPMENKKIGSFVDMKYVEIFPWTGNNKGTDFYIISKKCCHLFIDYMNSLKNKNVKIKSPIDHFMGVFLKYQKSDVYWCDTEITIHGSWGDGWGKNAVFKNSMGAY